VSYSGKAALRPRKAPARAANVAKDSSGANAETSEVVNRSGTSAASPLELEDEDAPFVA
jgi:hypothetical protein